MGLHHFGVACRGLVLWRTLAQEKERKEGEAKARGRRKFYSVLAWSRLTMATSKTKKALAAAEELKAILDQDSINGTETDAACEKLHNALREVADIDKRKKVAMWLGSEHFEHYDYWIEQQTHIWGNIPVEDMEKHQLAKLLPEYSF